MTMIMSRRQYLRIAVSMAVGFILFAWALRPTPYERMRACQFSGSVTCAR